MNKNNAFGYMWLIIAFAMAIIGYQLGAVASIIISQIWMSSK